MNLVLSLFPGIGLLDTAFEGEGFCVVRGPDLLWGGNVKRFHPPAGHFDGVIGGPPCPSHSSLAHLVRANGREPAEDLIPEFVRCVEEAQPSWFLSENAPGSPAPSPQGYAIWTGVLNNRQFGAEQNRERRWTFGVRGEQPRSLLRFMDLWKPIAGEWEYAVCASGTVKPGRPKDRALRGKHMGWKTAEALRISIRAQGLEEDFLDKAPFTLEGKHRVVGNGVPLPLGRAVARAVRLSLGGAA